MSATTQVASWRAKMGLDRLDDATSATAGWLIDDIAKIDNQKTKISFEEVDQFESTGQGGFPEMSQSDRTRYAGIIRAQMQGASSRTAVGDGVRKIFDTVTGFPGAVAGWLKEAMG